MSVTRTEDVDNTFNVRVTQLESELVPTVVPVPQFARNIASVPCSPESWTTCQTLTVEEARAQRELLKPQYNPEVHKVEIVKVKVTTIREEEVIE